MQLEGFQHEKVIIESEPGIFISLQLFHNNTLRPFILILDDDQQQILALLKKGFNVMIVAPRQGSNAGVRFHDPEYLTFCNSLFLGKPLIAQKVFDIIRSIDYLQTRGELYVHGKLALISTSSTENSMHALYSAVLDDRISCLAIHKPLVSFKAESPGLSDWHKWSLSLYLPYILEYADVDDLMSSLAPRALFLSEVKNTASQPVDLIKTASYLNRTKQAYPESKFTISPEFNFNEYISFLEKNCTSDR